MNIFILDEDFSINVSYYVNCHVNKMLIEYSQLLCNAHHFSGSTLNIPYKPCFKNHPCTKWARNSLSNYIWLIKLATELSKEYTYRYNKIHSCQKVIDWAINNIPNIPDIGLTEFVMAMPDEYKTTNIIQSYRNYYNGAKQHLFAWKNREIPYWIEITEVKELEEWTTRL